MAGKNVMVIGSGGREHALGWSIAQDEHVSNVFYCPGNAGTIMENRGINLSHIFTKDSTFMGLQKAINMHSIDIIVVGPEVPLTNGIVDHLYSRGFSNVFGPTKGAAQLESDKFFSYDLMASIDTPQAAAIKCTSTKGAIDAIKKMSTTYGVVIKARGLTEGKGVAVCDSEQQALEEITKHASLFGPDVLIAERLFGEEFSVFGISDGNRIFPFLMSVQDHKRLLDGDKGPNTGGMGAYAPAPVASKRIVRYVADSIMTPIIKRMKDLGREYKGFLYAGMIMTDDGPKVIEFNVRFGDPECQPAMMMLKNSIYQPISKALEGKLDESDFELKKGAACGVVLASKGYPGDYRKGLGMWGIDYADSIPGVKVFHAGTAYDYKHMNYITSGGRVLCVTAYSVEGIKEAQKLAYEGVSKILFEGGYSSRKDIAEKAFARSF